MFKPIHKGDTVELSKKGMAYFGYSRNKKINVIMGGHSYHKRIFCKIGNHKSLWMIPTWFLQHKHQPPQRRGDKEEGKICKLSSLNKIAGLVFIEK